jgi:hypothetical protein
LPLGGGAGSTVVDGAGAGVAGGWRRGGALKHPASDNTTSPQ